MSTGKKKPYKFWRPCAVGVLDEHQCFRHMCNLESVKTCEGTHDVHLLVLGEQITGMSAFAG